MKKMISYLFSVLLVGIYMLSTMGYGVHQCVLEGSNDIIVMFNTTPCEYAHSKSGILKKCLCETVHGEEGTSHNNDCCSTETHSVSSDQVNSNNDIDQTPFFDFSYPVHNCTETDVVSDFLAFAGAVYPTGFKMPLTGGLHIQNSQFRV